MGPDLSNRPGCTGTFATRKEESVSIGSTALLGLGSNLGDRIAHLRAGVRRLVGAGAVRIEAVSSLYASDPVDAEGGEFLNAVVRVSTDLPPLSLLAHIKDVERFLGRTGSRGDARTLDVDILYYDSNTSSDPTLPHPRRFQRPFVVVPLSEVCGEVREPDSVTTVARTVAPLLERFRCSLRLVAGPGWLDTPPGEEEKGPQ
jgi:2-amino-4-hydroxy-6-hydroxymethyldihydropteridine diphosphokinase